MNGSSGQELELDPADAGSPAGAPEDFDTASDAEIDILGQYLKETHRYPLLDPKTEQEISRALRESERAVLKSFQEHPLLEERQRFEQFRKRMIESNLRLVVSIAKRYQRLGLELTDLVQEGNIGLMQAVERFDPTRDLKFSTYATWWIRQAISRALSQKSRTIKVPINKVGLARVVSRARRGLEERLGRPPTSEEMSKAIGAPIEVVDVSLSTIPRIESLDVLAMEDGSARWELLTDEKSPSPWESAFHRDMREKLHKALEVLPPRQRLILRMRYGIGFSTEYSLEAIGKVLNLTRERVRQLEAQALRRLRSLGERRDLGNYLRNR